MIISIDVMLGSTSWKNVFFQELPKLPPPFPLHPIPACCTIFLIAKMSIYAAFTKWTLHDLILQDDWHLKCCDIGLNQLAAADDISYFWDRISRTAGEKIPTLISFIFPYSWKVYRNAGRGEGDVNI